MVRASAEGGTQQRGLVGARAWEVRRGATVLVFDCEMGIRPSDFDTPKSEPIGTGSWGAL